MKKHATYWLELAYCYTKLGKYQDAIEAYIQAIHLAPREAAGYLACSDCYILMEDFEQAEKTCDVGLALAHKHKNEPWAKKLQKALDKGKKEIEEHFSKSKYGTFTS